MARRNALVRHLPAVEALGSATVICTDKTGTLTENRMTVRQIYLDGQSLAPASSRWQTPAGQRFLAVAQVCHNLGRGSGGQWLGDPMETALAALGPPRPETPRRDELPFDTDRKRLTVLHETAQGLEVYVKGAPETVLPLCHSVQEGDARHTLDEVRRKRFLDAQDAMAAKGLRVLAFAWRPAGKDWRRDELENALILLGLVGLEDPPRAEVPAAICRCREAGIRVVMVTGDHPRTALAIGREIGLVTGERPTVLTGDDLCRLSGTQLQIALDTPEILFARLSADQKLRIVSAFQRKGEVVAATGDGVNDAPALKRADIGIAMGLCGTEVAREAADMVLLDDNFASIVAAVEEGRAVYDNIRKFLTYILSSNIAEALPFLAFVLFRIPLPLTIMQILAVDLGTDLLPALSLGAERPRPGVMQRPPRPRRERLLHLPLLARAYLFLGLMEGATALAAFFFVLHGAGWHYGLPLAEHDPLYLKATTATLTAIIVMQAMNVFQCRSERESVFTLGIFSNRLIWLGIAVETLLALAINYTAAGHWLYGTAPSDAALWLFVVPFASGMLILEETRKGLVRWQRNRIQGP
jgi:calcium-translocating P-type ATPase